MHKNLVTIDIPYVADSAAVFDALSNDDWPIWLDSGKGFSDARNSGGHHIDVIAANPIKKIYFDPENSLASYTAADSAGQIGSKTTYHTDISTCFFDIEAILKQHSHSQPHGPGWLGYLSYDLFDRFEHITKKQKQERIPQITLGFYAVTIVSNHHKKTTSIFALPHFIETAKHITNAIHKIFDNKQPVEDSTQLRFELLAPFQAATSKEDYRQQFEAVKEFILQGDCYQINLTQEFYARCNGPGLPAYKALRQAHSSPMSAYFCTPDFEILSMSPERFVAKRGQQLATYPIKGTRPRGTDRVSENVLKSELAESQKDRAENVMIVDLLRNDFGRICEKGSIKAEKLFQIESFPNVHHLVSTISGRLTPKSSLFDVVKAIFPGGSITGAPKVRAMEIIEDLENHRRSIYCGSIVHFSGNGDFDSNIAIRSLLIKDNEIFCWGGGGIVADSDCDKEYQETWDKVGRLMSILEERFQ